MNEDPGALLRKAAEHHEDPETKVRVHKDNTMALITETAAEMNIDLANVEIVEGQTGLNLFMANVWGKTYGKYREFGIAIPSEPEEPFFSRQRIRNSLKRLKDELEASKQYVKPLLITPDHSSYRH